jgi:DNA invertase Pin-like site-specific DNA recombinase
MADVRLGFQHLLTWIRLVHVGLILGLEMGRLARWGKDWHRLIELCAIFRVLLADEDGLYDLTDHNDRLLAGLTPARTAASSSRTPQPGIPSPTSSSARPPLGAKRP